MDTGLQGSADLFRLLHMTFQDDWNPEPAEKTLDQRPGDGASTFRIGGISIQGRGDSVCSSVLSGESILKRGNIREDWPPQFLMNTRNDLCPWFGLGKATLRAIQRDDVRTGITDLSCGLEIGGNVNPAVSVLPLVQANDRKICLRPKRGYPFSTFGPQPTGAALQNGDGDTREGLCIIQWIAMRSLARNHQAPT